MSESAILQISNLSKNFILERNFWGQGTKTLQAVRNISFDIFRGECLTIVGESGCGKSTLARLVLKLIDSDSGELVFQGQNLNTLDSNSLRHLRRDMQMVFQNPYASLDPRYSIFDSIAEPLQVHHYKDDTQNQYRKHSKEEIKTRVKELLDLVELDQSILSKKPHECSGGQNQRINIARAIALNPKLIVADEAVSALDVSIQWKILELFRKLQRELNISILFIAHNLGVVKYLADRVAVMYLGEIVELGLKEEIFANPQHPYTQALINAAPIPDPLQRNRQRSLLTGEIPKPTEIPSGCSFHTRCPYKKDICTTQRPENRNISSSHQASCHLIP